MLRTLEGSDASVQGTNDDAQISKLSCSKAGYFRDDFIHFFVRKASRRSPLINRGYYSRHAALRQLLASFLTAARTASSGTASGSGGASGRVPQVLVLGAGFDTTWFQLTQDAGGVAPYRCLEVDFKEVTQRKAAIIAKEPQLHSLLRQQGQQSAGQQQRQQGQPAQGQEAEAAAAAPASSAAVAADAAPAAAASSASAPGPGRPDSGCSAGSSRLDPELDPAHGQVVSSHYCLVPVDLRDTGALDRAVALAGWDRSALTYVLSECVLVYLEPQHSSAVVAWAAGAFPNAVMAIYEQIRPDDAFGRQMVSNLEMRGCPLRGLPATPTLEAHKARLTGGGWSWSDARSMDELYRSFVDATDRARAERLELFDELEEWHMIQEHYCIAVGRNDAAGWLSGFGFGPRQPAAAPPPPLFPGAGPAAWRPLVVD